ncbi:MAG: hypothetical protein ACOYD4_08550 [Solirubrobacterales bacterium]
MGVALAVLICSATPAAAPAVASGPTRAHASATGTLPIPGGFRLQASNGYTLQVLSVPPHKGHPGSVLLVVSGTHRGVTYTAPATITESSIQANLGTLGEISVGFQRSGRPATAQCGKETISFDSGHFEGRIEFHGEEGYTDAEATSVPGNIDFYLKGLCGGFFSGGGGGPRRGAQLYIRNPALGPELTVVKSHPGAAAWISVSVTEFTSGIGIHRFTSLRMPTGRFTYDRRLRAATLHPPAPFAGTARFDRDEKAGKRWSGDLTVDMPGRAGVPLTGSALRATLVPSE